MRGRMQAVLSSLYGMQRQVALSMEIASESRIETLMEIRARILRDAVHGTLSRTSLILW